MDGLLNEVSTIQKTRKQSEDALIEVEVIKKSEKNISRNTIVKSPTDALEVFRNEPGFDALSSTLAWLKAEDDLDSGFRIRRPSPISAQLINALISEIVPAYWSILSEKGTGSGKRRFKHDAERNALLSCLNCMTGINAILVRLGFLTKQSKESTNVDNIKIGRTGILGEHIDLLESLLREDTTIMSIWDDISLESHAMQKIMWREFTHMIAGGKLLSMAAEASFAVQDHSKTVIDTPWIGNGLQYSRWLGRNLRLWAKRNASLSKDAVSALSSMLSRALKLGYSDAILEKILELVLGDKEDTACFRIVSDSLSSQDQKSLLDVALRTLSKRFAVSTDLENISAWFKAESVLVGATAGYLGVLVDDKEDRKMHLVSWLTSSTGAGLGEGIGIRRSVVAALAKTKSDMEIVFEESLQQFGDQLYIKHTPILQQEVHAQVLLITAGCLHRISKLALAMSVKSGPYLSAISNHLSANSRRSRFLGMVVGEALSGMVEKGDKQMRFKIDDLESPEALWYKSLVDLQDSVQSMDPLRATNAASIHERMPRNSKAPSTTKPTVKLGQSKIISIEELDDDYEDDDDIVPYTKIDSDTEDSDEDPTLVVRNKPTAPVYVRDLITYLRDSESYDRQKLALTAASSLIRRKTNFGTEVTSHATELASLLVGLQNKYDIPDFQDYRLQGMIAVVLSDPKIMAPWFAKTFFDGDYSVSQRASILTVLSVSARELAGLAEQDAFLTKVSKSADNFPSKALPPRMHALYGTPQQSAIDALSTSLFQSMIAPLAADAADKATGPNILKVRTFSSRLEVEARRKKPAQNTLATLSGPCYFFPLTARFRSYLHANLQSNSLFSSPLLSSFLKTLSLIFHASGPYTKELGEMTSEYWDLLFSVLDKARDDRSTGQAVLMGFFTILEVQGERDMRSFVEAFGSKLNETQRWTDAYFGMVAGGSEEDDKVKSLAAAVLVRISEVVQKYQALLVGSMGGGL